MLDEALCLIAPRGRRERPAPSVRLRDLPDYPLIIPGRPHAIRTLVETKLAALGLRPQVALEIDAVSAILELVAEGQGYADPLAAGACTTPRPRASSARGPSCSHVSPARSPSPCRRSDPPTPLQSACVELVANLVPRGAPGPRARARPSARP